MQLAMSAWQQLLVASKDLAHLGATLLTRASILCIVLDAMPMPVHVNTACVEVKKGSELKAHLAVLLGKIPGLLEGRGSRGARLP